MRTGKDWTSLLKEVQEQPPPRSAETSEPFLGEERGEVSCYILNTSNAWTQMSLGVFLSSNLKSLNNSRWALKVTKGSNTFYFCGSDEVYNHLNDKQRLFIHDLVAELYERLKPHGMQLKDFWKNSLRDLMLIEKACRVLGASLK